MLSKLRSSAALLASALMLAGCAEGGALDALSLTTQSNPEAQASAQPKVDPACVQLSARIDALRKEGSAERVEKAAVGKTQTVTVKRASLAKVAELDKANADFQARCSTVGARPAVAAAPAQPAVPAAATQVASAAQTKAAGAAQAKATAAAAKAAPAAAKAVTAAAASN